MPVVTGAVAKAPSGKHPYDVASHMTLSSDLEVIMIPQEKSAVTPCFSLRHRVLLQKQGPYTQASSSNCLQST